MAFMDSTLVFSNDQTVSASAISDFVFDLTATPANQQLGYVYFNCIVGTTAIAGDTFTISLLTKATEPSSKSGTILADIVIADGVGVVGATLCSVQIPTHLLLRWVGVYYTDAGSISTGTVETWFGMEPARPSRNYQVALS